MTRMNNSEPPFWLFLLPLVGLTAGIVILFRWPAYARSVLQQWASAKRFEVLDSKQSFWCGGFSWSVTSHQQVVFFVRVRDDLGHERSGWVRFSRPTLVQLFTGKYEDEPDVIWSEQRTAA
jgi:hypothetical protein